LFYLSEEYWENIDNIWNDRIHFVDNSSDETILFFPSTISTKDDIENYIDLLDRTDKNILFVSYNWLESLCDNEIYNYLFSQIIEYWKKKNLDIDTVVWVWFSSYFVDKIIYDINIENVILISPTAWTKSFFERNLFWFIHNIFNKNSFSFDGLGSWDFNYLLIKTNNNFYWENDAILKSFDNWQFLSKKKMSISTDSLEFLPYYKWPVLAHINDFIWEKLVDTIEVKVDTKKYNPLEFYDFEADYSIHKFVNNKVSFNNISYIPENLVEMTSDYYNTSKYMTLSKRAEKNFENMSKAFYKEFWKKILVVSAYRSYLYQKWIKDRGCPDNLCAKAWYSEHQTWLTVDIFEATTKDDFMSKKHLNEYYKWLYDNAHKYWFHNTYQKWVGIDWYEIEPWHWRYLWVWLSTYLKRNNITFAELYNNLEN